MDGNQQLPGNVVDLQEKKRARAKVGSKKGDFDWYGFYLNVLAAFTKHKSSQLPPFEENFVFVEFDDGSRVPFHASSDKVLTPVVPDAVIGALLRYTQRELAAMNISFLPRHASELYSLIKAMAKPIRHSDILPIAERSTDEYSWHKLPFDLHSAECPTFTELVSRTTAPEIVKAFIGSLFYNQSDRHQYMWIYGAGMNGKSRLANLLKRIMGPSYKTEVVPDKTGQRFWTAGLIGKRLVVFDDCNNYGFPASGFFKGLTGNESVRIERKGIDSYDTELHCKFMFLSNEIPNIHHNTAETRRALFIEINPISGPAIPTNEYDAKLWAEAPAIIYECKKTYRELCPNFENIPTERIEDTLRGVIDDTEEKILELIHAQFHIDINNPNWYVTATEFTDWIIGSRFDNHLERQIRSVLRNRYLVKSQVKRFGERTQKVYPGLCLKNGRTL